MDFMQYSHNFYSGPAIKQGAQPDTGRCLPHNTPASWTLKLDIDPKK